MSSAESIIIVSPIASGANTLKEHLRGVQYAGKLVIPEMVTSGYGPEVESELHTHRPLNCVPDEQFDRMNENGEFSVVWTRKREDIGKLLIRHAFPLIPETDSRLRILFSNSAMLKTTERSVEDFVDQNQVLELSAQWEIRWQRLLAELGSEEKVKRIMKWHEQNDDLLPMGYRPKLGVLDTTDAKGDPNYVINLFGEFLKSRYGIKTAEQKPNQLDLF